MLDWLVTKVYAVTDCIPGAGTEGIDLGNCLRLSNDSAIKDVYSEPAFLVNLIVKNLFVVSGVILFVMLFFAGFKFVSAGKKGVEDGKKIFTSVLVGLALLFSAYWIVQIVQLLTGVDVGL
ncbi:MAG: hypothetical protein GW947_03520 [Candidatus Pacebacteria bacterium]|nr:hypothetical protein [Candidatus Paceibacterota bacterium]PIR59626.1 MAG: hypothetical protein COU68_04595 [Candidatus Pacebacteria bacterium CG10_big_fil_rev_8_21_14_0_10_45_6]